MSTTTSSIVVLSRRDIVLARLAAYCELSKPRIAALELVVVAVSAYLGAAQPNVSTWIATLVGTALIAASASAMNQVLERRSDALMDRTAERPLPSGRVSLAQALGFAAATGVTGILCMAGLVNLPTAIVGALTWFLYVAVYTPLKAKTTANTGIGAVAGAMPVFIGWAASGASFSLTSGPAAGGIRVAALFLIVYLWQFPHFMAIAWLYRRQYAAAGLKMLPVVEPTGARAGAQAMLGALALVPISLLPLLGGQNPITLAGTVSLAVAYVLASALFCWRRDESSARRLLQTSLVYLPGILLMLVLSPIL